MYWCIAGDPSLSTARRVVEDAANEVLVSPASYGEFAIKRRIGKW
jgi:PIN domain nuclease of toxin-antitoxin system